MKALLREPIEILYLKKNISNGFYYDIYYGYYLCSTETNHYVANSLYGKIETASVIIPLAQIRVKPRNCLVNTEELPSGIKVRWDENKPKGTFIGVDFEDDVFLLKKDGLIRADYIYLDVEPLSKLAPCLKREISKPDLKSLGVKVEEGL